MPGMLDHYIVDQAWGFLSSLGSNVGASMVNCFTITIPAYSQQLIYAKSIKKNSIMGNLLDCGTIVPFHGEGLNPWPYNSKVNNLTTGPLQPHTQFNLLDGQLQMFPN